MDENYYESESWKIKKIVEHLWETQLLIDSLSQLQPDTYQKLVYTILDYTGDLDDRKRPVLGGLGDVIRQELGKALPNE